MVEYIRKALTEGKTDLIFVKAASQSSVALNGKGLPLNCTGSTGFVLAILKPKKVGIEVKLDGVVSQALVGEASGATVEEAEAVETVIEGDGGAFVAEVPGVSVYACEGCGAAGMVVVAGDVLDGGYDREPVAVLAVHRLSVDVTVTCVRKVADVEFDHFGPSVRASLAVTVTVTVGRTQDVLV